MGLALDPLRMAKYRIDAFPAVRVTRGRLVGIRFDNDQVLIDNSMTLEEAFKMYRNANNLMMFGVKIYDATVGNAY
ncbi:hypothetical protein GGF32_006799 [Allomyces javanicus]|nr:hypothetical protein GGF32_006799 [Allomyces javanicus]